MPRSPFQVLVIPYLIEDSRVLYACLKRSDEGNWQFIAGGGEDDETPLEAAIRETAEEAGIETTAKLQPLETLTMIPGASVSDLWKDVLDIPEYTFAVAVYSRRLIISDEHLEYCWCDYETARTLLKWESNRNALRELHHYIKSVEEREENHPRHPLPSA